MKLNEFYFIKKIIGKYIKKYNSDKTVTLSLLLEIFDKAEKELQETQANLDEIIEHSKSGVYYDNRNEI
jgi:DnaJ-domain-containing protein 1